MKINVYEVNQLTEKQGKIAGILTYASGALTLQSTYPEIDDAVNDAYKAVKNGSHSGKHYTKEGTHKFSTPEFVEAFGVECWKKGFMIEVVE